MYRIILPHKEESITKLKSVKAEKEVLNQISHQFSPQGDGFIEREKSIPFQFEKFLTSIGKKKDFSINFRVNYINSRQFFM